MKKCLPYQFCVKNINFAQILKNVEQKCVSTSLAFRSSGILLDDVFKNFTANLLFSQYCCRLALIQF